jgi:hypothetical protein
MDMRPQWWLSLALAWLVAGCGDDAASEVPEDAGARDDVTTAAGRAVLTDRAVVLDDAALAALASSETRDEQTELTFASSEVLGDVEAGDVLIIGVTEATPNGALLEVESVTRGDSELTLLAHRAELGAAFEALSIQLEAELARPISTRGARNALSRGVAVSEQALGLAFPFSIPAEGDNDSELSGSLAIDSSFGLALDFSFEDGLEELSMRLDVEETFRAELLATGEATFDEQVELGSIGFAPITILIPGVNVPIILTPQLAIEAGVSGALGGAVEASVVQEASFNAGVGLVDGEFDAFSGGESTFQVNPPTYEASVNLRAWGGPRMEVLIYGAVGPFVSASAFVEFAAQIEGPPPCATGVLNAGLVASVGVDVIADYATTLPIASEPLAQYDSCMEEQDPNAPRPAITWSRTYARADSPGETARAVIEASDGSFIVVGHSDLYEGVTGFAAAAWVLRVDALGQVIWQRAFRREALGLVRGLAEVGNGFLIAGDAGVMKIDTGGNPAWARSYTDDALVTIASIAAQDDGRFVVAGSSGVDSHAWAMGLDQAGQVLWSRSFAGEDFGRVRATSDGGYALVGKVREAFDISVVKLDAEGEVQWSRLVDNLFDPNPEEGDVIATSDDRAFDIAEKPDGGYVIVGEAYGNFPLPEPTPVGFYGTWVVEIDADGELAEAGSVTHRAPRDALYGGAYAVAVREDGSSVIVGRRADTASDLLATEDILVIQGLSYSVLGGAGYDNLEGGGTLSGLGRGMPLALTADGGAIIAATSDSFSDRDEIWLIKLNRTAGINIPERSSVDGSSFVNGHAQSTDFDASPTEVPVTATTFTTDVDWETTEVVNTLTR